MDWAYLLNSFDGRIGRQTFWIAFGVVMAAEIADVISSPSSFRVTGSAPYSIWRSPIRNSPSP